MKYVIGIDIGTSAVKSVLVSEEGRVVCEHAESYPLHRPNPGWSEQNPEDWAERTIASLRKLMEKSQVAPSDVEGISFSGQMHGLVLVDAEASRFVRPSCGMTRGRRRNAAGSSRPLEPGCWTSPATGLWKVLRFRNYCGCRNMNRKFCPERRFSCCRRITSDIA